MPLVCPKSSGNSSPGPRPTAPALPITLSLWALPRPLLGAGAGAVSLLCTGVSPHQCVSPNRELQDLCRWHTGVWSHSCPLDATPQRGGSGWRRLFLGRVLGALWIDAAVEASLGVSPLSSQHRGLSTRLSPSYVQPRGWWHGRWLWLHLARSCSVGCVVAWG